MTKKQKTIEAVLFLVLTGLIFFLGIACYYVHVNIDAERSGIAKTAELEALSYKLAGASDYLTSEVQKFAVTLDPVHLRNYWMEVNVTQTREKVINRLKELNIPPEEFNLLNKAKNNSDDLVNTETRAMKLILCVYNVPEDQMEQPVREYQLTNDDRLLSDNGKVNLAREILYNSRYEMQKKKIMQPISGYAKKMSARVQKENQAAEKNTNLSLTLLLIAVVAILLYAVILTRLLLVHIFFPLKTFLLDLDDPQKNAEELLLKSRLMGILKNAMLKRKTG